MIKSIAVFFILFFIGCKSTTGDRANMEEKNATANEQSKGAKYEPKDGRCILFVGQELEAIGGLEKWQDGYMDHFDRPGGFTMYTKIRPGDEEFGFTYDGLAGIHTTDDWGDGPSNMSLQIADSDFQGMALAIGLEIVNHETEIADGELDSLVLDLGYWLKGLGDRPVFLRIGYEFAGSWNNYDREDYIRSFQRIRTLYDSIGVSNVAYVWQSHGSGEPLDLLESWYPGDAYVDWCGFSFFAWWDQVNMIEFARQKGKPVFIAEATPTLKHPTKEGGKTKETILSNPAQAKEAWDQWFIPFFDMIYDNPDVVKAVSYINCHWKAHRMWYDNPTFQDVDARLHTNKEIANLWKVETDKDVFVKASPDILSDLKI